MSLGIDARAAFLRTASAARDVLAAPEVAAAWDRPSALAAFSVRGLAGHLARGAWVVEEYLDAGIADDARDVGDAAGYYLDLALGRDVDDPLNQFVRERGEHEAEGGRDAVLARLDGALARLTDRLTTLAVGQPMTALAGMTLPVEEYLVTRIIELLTHTDDLAVSVGIPSPAPDPDSATLAIECLVELGRRRHGDLPVLRALTRRERDSIDALRAF